MFVWPTSHMGMMHPAGDIKARSMAKDFLTYAEASEAGVSYKDAKTLLSVSTNQAETRKSFYEELALLYVPYRSNKIILTPLGCQLFSLLNGADFANLPSDVTRQATALIVWAMCRSQINRPQSRGVPKLADAEWKACNVRPYAAAWQAISDLSGEVSLDEFMGALRYLQKYEQYPSVIERILAARASGQPLASENDLGGRSLMNYRIYWRSHLSLAEQVLRWDQKNLKLTIVPENWDIVKAALQFQAGCAADMQAVLGAAPWTDADDYFMNVAGAECPPFLASGAPTLTTFEGQTLADLSGYSLDSLTLAGGPELCHLKILMPCFHPDSPHRLLRIDAKQQTGSSILLRMGLGRPIVNLAVLKAALENGNG